MQRTEKFFKRKCIVYKIVRTSWKDFFSQSEKKATKTEKQFVKWYFNSLEAPLQHVGLHEDRFEDIIGNKTTVIMTTAKHRLVG